MASGKRLVKLTPKCCSSAAIGACRVRERCVGAATLCDGPQGAASTTSGSTRCCEARRVQRKTAGRLKEIGDGGRSQRPVWASKSGKGGLCGSTSDRQPRGVFSSSTSPLMLSEGDPSQLCLNVACKRWMLAE